MPPERARLSRSRSRCRQFLAKGPLDPNALYQIQGGATTSSSLAAEFRRGRSRRRRSGGRRAGRASDLAAQVGKLQAAGAQYIVVQNLPDIGKTPGGGGAERSRPRSPALSRPVQLDAERRGRRRPACRSSSSTRSALLNEIIANPSLLRFRQCDRAGRVHDAELAQLHAVDARRPVRNPLKLTSFADGVHPTTSRRSTSARRRSCR